MVDWISAQKIDYFEILPVNLPFKVSELALVLVIILKLIFKAHCFLDSRLPNALLGGQKLTIFTNLELQRP